MELTKQVVSLELAKRLKELGVKQESEFYWRKTESEEVRKEWEEGDGKTVIVGHTKPRWYLTRRDKVRGDKGIGITYEVYSAFTVAELGEMLPGNDGECCFVTQKGLMGNLWYCSRETMYSKRSEHTEEAKTEADARAQMLIYLLESSLIKEPAN